MTIQNIIDMAKVGELQNIGVRNDVAAMVSFINMGLIELYKRFNINTNEVVITLGQNGDSINPYTMINSTTYQLPSDMLSIVAAYGEIPAYDMAVRELPINEENELASINTIAWNKIQVPITMLGNRVSIIYASMPPMYTVNDLNSNIELPMTLLDALLSYMGYKARVTLDDNVQIDSVYWQRFETICADALKYGAVTSDDMSMSYRFEHSCFA